MATAAAKNAIPNPAPAPQPKKRWSRLRALKRIIQLGAVGAVGYASYVVYQNRHPTEQKQFDPSKRTIVLLGTGWGAVSFLKKLNTDDFNVIIVSPRNYFLFTPLLPSCTVGTIELRSIMEPIRFITRHKSRNVKFYESECTDIDPESKTISITDVSDIKGAVSNTTIPYDYLVVAIGADNQTFGMAGVREHACFLKEIWDAQKIRTRLMDCVESAGFASQTPEEVSRLLHMVVVGGGPTGVEYAAELHDFLKDDLQIWYPELVDKLRITLVEALPNVLPMFSSQLIQYTERTFKQNNIEVLTKTMVKEVADKEIKVMDANKNMVSIPYGLLVWATGNCPRPLARKLMARLKEGGQSSPRGLLIDEYMRVAGAQDMYAIGDCTFTKYAPTAQVATQQGLYLASVFANLARIERGENRKISPFEYTHQGSLAYIGSDRAIADLPFLNGNVSVGGVATYVFWRSVYISNMFSFRNRFLVVGDWVKSRIFGRDVSRE
ncbi:pyridine nucleotide-disulfide oxidoreductase-domain-containing protein [Lobosporangium transversale]|uniref:NADH:ubiquinone reductase (non-electrogenic) n=1 Tax=Lobosporangium transversale TaxID=64571 RepID=A0A1Y2GXZ5_9FUNG|nr:pyridine nucleotide-disulfide oxidoreductase-domain-containing protein [Lobosporangium transversale]ORZ22903.1 pyridine nucleotide-disulfide oxidoreductase-domain-containing protein [Lobosporangium transversale]|eukprot:XP_021883457.1 pyridine nucleotide-disulfide oxidoreductase-domain-containing protein [Lobosporangium transversale]